MNPGIVPTDVIPLLNLTFHRAYGVVTSNRKAVYDCSWFPPNRKLLDHSSLINDTTKNAPASSASSANDINIEDGLGAEYLDQILNDKARKEGAVRAVEERREKGCTVERNMKEANKLTSSLLAANRIHSINHPVFINVYKEKRKEVRDKQDKSKFKKGSG